IALVEHLVGVTKLVRNACDGKRPADELADGDEKASNLGHGDAILSAPWQDLHLHERRRCSENTRDVAIHTQGDDEKFWAGRKTLVIQDSDLDLSLAEVLVFGTNACEQTRAAGLRVGAKPAVEGR